MTGRRAAAVLLAAAGLYAFGGGWAGTAAVVESLSPAARPGPTDFYQFWAAARDRQAGRSLYEPLADTFPHHAPDLGPVTPFSPADVLPMNAYPPIANAPFAPLARLTYADTLCVWRWALFGCLAAAAGLLAWELVPGRKTVRLCVGAAVFLFLSGSAGAVHDVGQGNVGCLLLLLVVGAWAAGRRGHRWAAGGLAALAAGLKLFPGLLAIHYAFTDRRTLARMAAAGAALAGLSLAVYGWDEHRRFVGSAAAGKAWYARYYNHSLAGYWHRLFHVAGVSRYGMTTAAPVEPLTEAPALAAGLTLGSAAAVLGALLWAGRRGPEPDAYFGATVAAMVLLSPVTWAGGTLLAAVPIGLLLTRGRGGVAAGCAVVLWMLPGVWEGWLGITDATRCGPWDSVTHLGLKTYALLGLFAGCLRATPRNPVVRRNGFTGDVAGARL